MRKKAHSDPSFIIHYRAGKRKTKARIPIFALAGGFALFAKTPILMLTVGFALFAKF